MLECVLQILKEAASEELSLKERQHSAAFTVDDRKLN